MTRRVRIAAVVLGFTSSGVVLGLVGAAVCGFDASWLGRSLRRPLALRKQDDLIRRLWWGTRDFEGGRMFSDAESGCLLTVHRFRGFTTLVVVETTGDLEGVCRSYFLAFAGVTQPAPLLRGTDHIDLPETGSVSRRLIADVLDFGEASGAMHADTAEIIDVIGRVDRAISLDNS